RSLDLQSLPCERMLSSSPDCNDYQLWLPFEKGPEMSPDNRRRVAVLATSLGAILLAAVAVMAAAPTPRPSSSPDLAPAVDQHGPTIKDTYRNHFLIGMAGDLPGNYSDVEK